MSTSDRKHPGIFSLDVLLPTTILTSSVFFSRYLYKAWFKRIPNVRRLPDSFIKKRTLYGKVTSVGDADNFHFYHTPGGILGGWGWLRKEPGINAKGLRNQTLHVRLCGVDAPEAAHFGKPAQKYSGEALDWLRSYILGKKVRITPLARDQYGRVVSEAKVWKLTGRKNVSMEMLRNGWAVVYEAKQGAEFNGNEDKFRHLEQVSRKKKLGIFQDGLKKFVSPGQFKRAHKD